MRPLDLDDTASDNHGLVTRTSSKLSRSAWYRAISAGSLEQMHPGVARLPGTVRSYRQRLAAAVLAVHEPTNGGIGESRTADGGASALASHRSSAALWLGWTDETIDSHFTPGEELLSRSRRSRDSAATDDDLRTRPSEPLAAIDLLVIGKQRVRTLDGITLHRATDRKRLTPARVDDIRCTNILRTLIDLGAVQPATVSTLLGHALATGLADLGAVETVLSQHARRGRAGTRALREAIDEWAIDSKPADSVLEIAFSRLVRRFGLPPVEFHPMIEGWEVDFRFVGTRVLVECDGWSTHGLDRRQFERDRRRDAELGAAGWIVSRHTYRAITLDASTTARRLADLVARCEAG